MLIFVTFGIEKNRSEYNELRMTGKYKYTQHRLKQFAKITIIENRKQKLR